MSSEGREDRVLVQMWVPKELAKRLNHVCIDLERRRNEVVAEVLEAWLSGLDRDSEEAER